MWSCCSACLCNDSSITICLPYSITQSFTAMLSQHIQYVLMSCGICSLCYCQPCMLHSLRCCRCSSCDFTFCIPCTVIQSGILVVVCMASIFNCIPGISASFFPLWFCLEFQSAMNRSGEGLYMILTLYWCILSGIHCSL